MVALAKEHRSRESDPDFSSGYRGNQSNWLTYDVGGQKIGLSRYRIYDPETGVYISMDFLRFLNKYRAWSNRPTGQVDRDGLADAEAGERMAADLRKTRTGDTPPFPPEEEGKPASVLGTIDRLPLDSLAASPEAMRLKLALERIHKLTDSRDYCCCCIVAMSELMARTTLIMETAEELIKDPSVAEEQGAFSFALLIRLKNKYPSMGFEVKGTHLPGKTDVSPQTGPCKEISETVLEIHEGVHELQSALLAKSLGLKGAPETWMNNPEFARILGAVESYKREMEAYRMTHDAYALFISDCLRKHNVAPPSAQRAAQK